MGIKSISSTNLSRVPAEEATGAGPPLAGPPPADRDRPGVEAAHPAADLAPPREGGRCDEADRLPDANSGVGLPRVGHPRVVAAVAAVGLVGDLLEEGPLAEQGGLVDLDLEGEEDRRLQASRSPEAALLPSPELGLTRPGQGRGHKFSLSLPGLDSISTMCLHCIYLFAIGDFFFKTVCVPIPTSRMHPCIMPLSFESKQ